MERYLYTKTSNAYGKRAYLTTALPSIPKTPGDRYIFAKEGDRLDSVSYEFYDDARYWFILAIANNIGKGSFIIPPGLQLRIPPKIIVFDMLALLQEAEQIR